MTGKNFSTNNATGKRRKSDFYETPYSLTELLLEVEEFPERVLEPAQGGGAIVRVLNRHGFEVSGFDKEVNFLTYQEVHPAIITNPPFSLAKEFIFKAKEVASEKFAMLLPLSYLHGKFRFDNIYQDREYPLKKEWVFTRYPLLGDLLREDGKHRTGMMVYAWYVWEKGVSEEPTIGWLDNNRFILRKEENDCN